MGESRPTESTRGSHALLAHRLVPPFHFFSARVASGFFLTEGIHQWMVGPVMMLASGFGVTTYVDKSSLHTALRRGRYGEFDGSIYLLGRSTALKPITYAGHSWFVVCPTLS